MDNRQIANLLAETADLLEIAAGDPFRIRSYRRAAEAVESSTIPLSQLAVEDPKKLLTIAGIGKGMAANILEIEKAGTLPLREELLVKYKPSMLELLKLPGMGPKSVALFWEVLQVADIDQLEAAIAAGKLEELPRFGAKAAEKLKKGIAEYRKNSGRFHLDDAEIAAEKITAYLLEFPGIDRVTPAGSLRRGRDTVGDLDLLATGPICEEDKVGPAVDYMAAYPPIASLIAKGANKVSFRLRSGLQVDVRLLPQGSYGAALQYFTGSKMHNVTVRQRALKRGYTLSEYALAKVEDGAFVAGATEEEIYAALGMDWIAPELRENNGELEAALEHRLPQLITQADIRGDVHMHTVATDGSNTIREMAEAALARGYEYIAITDHSKNLAMTNGLDDQRALTHIAAIRQVERDMAEEFYEREKREPEGSPLKPRPGSSGTATSPRQLPIRVLAGIEVDILADGQLDLADETLAQMDIVIASVHTLFSQSIEEMTARVLRALENPYLKILGHPTGRKLLRRDAYQIHLPQIFQAAAAAGVAMEHNSNPNRLDLCDRDLKMAKEAGCKIVVNTDAHHTSEMENMRYGIRQLRRAWLTKEDVLNTLPADEFLETVKRR
ncbi:DNA polymerase X family [Acidisarcina polymorpha]|uniref:DNA-directed DNA polymerase n=1 Tax=Acidisarcina polymorpha TaxID=2211140 RepID=A0A2Z5FTD5_9BACT|nr:PHP domain-containing protein [Acidisarcina polymorpha]AXC09756.1 DNA polymerase X family [Acidisarcina polymorpha]